MFLLILTCILGRFSVCEEQDHWSCWLFVPLNNEITEETKTIKFGANNLMYIHFIYNLQHK